MGVMKEMKLQKTNAFTIGPQNPLIDSQVAVTWLKPWGGKPAGYTVVGTLKSTFCVNGRTLIGEVEIQGPHGKKTISAPWSRNYITIEKR